eukprot:TRINITY_DN11471_c1_g1_i3.p1 TRINITY_DN11471_c1_g1~~TRINITY_DN11471_c1_g1_i3.p1  ORF type:complete len:1006 (+),score=140.94 TRINITY_DN11471_c1_g1_i3:90-3020(+)
MASTILAAIILASIAATLAIPCTKDDYGKLVTPCQGNTLNEIFYRKVDCEGDADALSRYGLPCGCSPGRGISDDNDICQDCPVGKFSSGGLHYDVNDFSSWAPLIDSANTSIKAPAEGIKIYCAGNPCQSWNYLDEDGGILSSGNNSRNTDIRSVITFTHKFRANGEFYMKYRVSAYCSIYSATYCNGLTIYIDDQRVFPDSGRRTVQGPTGNYTTYNSTNSDSAKRLLAAPGLHEIKVEFSRSSYSIRGSESASIAFVTLKNAYDTYGLASETCRTCPPGYVNDKTGQSQCSECDFFEYSRDDHTGCLTCEDGKLSGPGSSECTPGLPCTEEDYFIIDDDVSKCTKDKRTGKWMRTSTAQWILTTAGGQQRKLCDLASSNVTLPTPARTECKCPPGQELKEIDGSPTCQLCGAGYYHNSTQGVCIKTDPGFVAIKSQAFTEFNTPFATRPNPEKPECNEGDVVCTSCEGDCLEDERGWQPRGHYTASGRAIGSADNILVMPNIGVHGTARLKYKCATDCRVRHEDRTASQASRESCYLEFNVYNESNGLITSFNCTSRFTNPNNEPSYRYSRRIEGDHKSISISIRFHQDDSARSPFEAVVWDVIVENTTEGGGLEQMRCPTGFKSNADGTQCLPCPPGTSSPADGPTDLCVACEGNTFTSAPGQVCAPCGAGTTTLADHTGCDLNDCKFTSDSGNQYDFSRLGSNGGDMTSIVSRYHTYSLNPCYTNHRESICVNDDGDPMPAMACYATNYSRVYWYDIGNVLGFEEISAGNVTLTMTNPYRSCYGTDGYYHTNVELICDPQAGLGQPTYEGTSPRNYYDCSYSFIWRSVYGCPLCGDDDYLVTRSDCIDGRQRVSYEPKIDCLGEREDTVQLCSDANNSNSNASNNRKGLSGTATIGVAVGFFVLVITLVAIALRNRALSDRYSVLANVARGTGDAAPVLDDDNHSDDQVVGGEISMRTEGTIDDDEDMLLDA